MSSRKLKRSKSCSLMKVILWIFFLPFIILFFICYSLYLLIKNIMLTKQKNEVTKLNVSVKALTDNPYMYAVPHEVYKNAYIDNKSKEFPNDYIVVDTETTGLEPEIDKIIEISAIKYKNGIKIDKFSQLVYPGGEIAQHITDLTGIKNSDLIGKPTINKVLPSFFDFVEDYVLVAHNMPFDIKMIACECYRSNIKLKSNKLIDTVPLAKKIISNELVSDYKLETIKKFLKINMPSHRGLVDCEMCNVIYKNYITGNTFDLVNELPVTVNNKTGEILEINTQECMK